MTEKIRGRLFGAAQNQENCWCYVILDAARSDAIYERLKNETGEGTSLFVGEKKKECAQVAPYLIKITKNALFTEWLFEYGWRDNWGVFLSSTETMDVLKKHFRNFLMFYDNGGRSFYFRYYDPKVLQHFLDSCLPDELMQFFGPVHAFYIKNEKNSAINQYRLENNGVLGNLILRCSEI